jgi:hypothetical protein
MSFSPIALFVYKRPEHTRRTIEALMRCPEFANSPVYVFCDGAKTSKDIETVDEARKVARGLLEERVHFKISAVNIGLANSIISGITELCERYGRVIVVEDDLVVAPVFLSYMNAALDRYSDDKEVMQVSGYMYPMPELQGRNTAFFLPVTTSWGWGTWERAWNQFDAKADGWQALITDKILRSRFNLLDEVDYFTMLKRQMSGMSDSWAIRWYWSVFKAKGLVLFPPQSYIMNIGFDGSGTHGFRSAKKKISSIQTLSNKIVNLPTKVEIDTAAYYLVRKYQGQLSRGMVPWVACILRNRLVQFRLVKKLINIKKM